MAITLPPIVHGPFSKYSRIKLSGFNGLPEPYPTISNASTATLTSVLSVNPRRTSTSSVLSVSLAPVQPRNNENRAANDFLLISPHKRLVSMHYPEKLRRFEVLSTRHNLDISLTSLPRMGLSRDLNEPSREEPPDTKSSKTEYLPGYPDQQPASLITCSVTET